MRHVLFVCTGNIFRSLTAEHAVRRALGPRTDILLSSAGTEDDPYEVRPMVRDYLLLKGFDVSTHRRRTLTEEILRSADLVVAMSLNHRDFIRTRFSHTAPVYLEACGGPADALPDIEEVISDYQTNPAAVEAHCRFTIDRIISLAPQFASRLDSLLAPR